MGFLDSLFDKEQKEKKKIAKMKKTIMNMYVQPQERQYTLQMLRDIGTDAAIDAILGRFDESSHNSTVDLEEKQYVYDILVDMHRHDARIVDLVIDHIKRAEEKVNWPLKVVQDIYDFEEMANFLREILDSMKTEYQRDPQKKQEIILRAAEFKNEKLAEALPRFLEDPNETVRFLTVETLLTQNFEKTLIDPLAELLADEESLRIVQKIALAFSEHRSWLIREDLREAVKLALPEGYGLHASGYIHALRT